MVTQTKSNDYLGPFTRLGPSIYVQEPDPSAHDAGDYPKTIIIAFWMNAFSRSLVKYVAEYHRLAPSARIIFIRTSSTEFMLRSTKRAQYARLAPAVAALQAATSSSSPSSSSPNEHEPVFIHMFSNGGMFAVTNLLEAYQQATGHSLRVSSTIIDSAPGTATLSGALKAFSYVLPKQWLLRLFSKVIMYSFLTSLFVIGKVFRLRDAVSVARKVMNDRRLMLGSGSGKDVSPKRCYIYSDKDELVHAADVESHASDAEAKGWVVRREKFLGSEHVCHMKADPERYWNTVKSYLYSKSIEST